MKFNYVFFLYQTTSMKKNQFLQTIHLRRFIRLKYNEKSKRFYWLEMPLLLGDQRLKFFPHSYITSRLISFDETRSWRVKTTYFHWKILILLDKSEFVPVLLMITDHLNFIFTWVYDDATTTQITWKASTYWSDIKSWVICVHGQINWHHSTYVYLWTLNIHTDKSRLRADLWIDL